MMCQVYNQLAFWAALVTVSLSVLTFAYKVRTRRYRTIETLALKNIPIPPSLLQHDHRQDAIYAGVFMTCLSIAIAAFTWAIAGTVIEGNDIPAWLPMIAVFPLMIGIAQFVKIAIARRFSR